MPNSSKTSFGSVPFPFCALDATQRGLWADAPNHADILTNMDLYMGLWDITFTFLVTSVGVTLTSL